MNKKIRRAIARVIILTLTILTIVITMHTMLIGFALITISEQNIQTESWRNSPDGTVAANNVYAQNEILRNEIYHSSNAYTRWISTASIFTQLFVGTVLICLTILSVSLYFVIIKHDFYRLKKIFQHKIKNHTVTKVNSTSHYLAKTTFFN